MIINEKIATGAKKMLCDCLGAKPDEQTLIVCDEKTIDIAYAFSYAGRASGLNVTLVEAQSQTKGDVPPLTATAMSGADCALLITSMSYSHTAARGSATEAGVRIASMPLLTEEVAENYLDADYAEISKRSIALASLLNETFIARITSPFGTDVVLHIEGRSGLADTGILTEPGSFGNLPAGEGVIAPVENVGEGIYVLMPDDCISYLGYVKDRVEISIKDGLIVDVAGDVSAQELRNFLNDKDQGALGIAELAAGTNPAARLIGHPLLDEKVMGTVHIAFGNNLYFGGKQDSNIHYDCITAKASLYLDDVCVIDEGVHIYDY